MSSLKVLLLEPDYALGGVYRAALERAGHSVVLCPGAQSAMEQLDVELPDVVVMELQLSRHSGAEFLYEFRSYQDLQQIPVVLHTFVPKQQVGLLQKLGVAAYLYKPTTTLRQFAQAVGRAVVA